MQETTGTFAASDGSQEETALCVIDQDGAILAEAEIPAGPDAIAECSARRSENRERFE